MQSSLGLTLLLDGALKGTLVLLAATALVVVLRHASAASRHMIWQFAVIAVLSLPILKIVSPFKLAVLPQWRSPIVSAEGPTATPTKPAEPRSDANVATRSSTSASSEVTTSRLETTTNVAPANRTSWTLVALKWTAFVWLAVAAALLLRLLLGFVSLVHCHQCASLADVSSRSSKSER